MKITKNDINLGKKIKKYRRKLGLTQEQLAEEVGLSQKYIQFIENGKRRPSLTVLYKISQKLNIKMYRLFY